MEVIVSAVNDLVARFQAAANEIVRPFFPRDDDRLFTYFVIFPHQEDEDLVLYLLRSRLWDDDLVGIGHAQADLAGIAGPGGALTGGGLIG